MPDWIGRDIRGKGAFIMKIATVGMKLCRRRHKNIAAVALAAKNARTAWAMLTRGQVYQASHVPARPTTTN